MGVPSGGDRVAVIGAGHVGATSAYALLQSGVCREIVLVDADRRRAEGEAMDISHAVPLASPVRVWAGDYSDACGAAVAVVAAGAGGKHGESRLDLLGRNAGIVRSVVSSLMTAGFDGIILMTTNPVDVLAHVALDESGLAPGRVIGSGTVLDTSRLRELLGEHLGVDPRSIHAHIIGEHGDSEVAAWSSARVGGVPLEALPGGQDLDRDDILSRVRSAAPEIIARKGYTSFAIASSVSRICAAVLGDEHAVLAVSTLADGEHGISGTYLSLPCIVGRSGVERTLELPLSDDELTGLRRSADVLRAAYESVQDTTDS